MESVTAPVTVTKTITAKGPNALGALNRFWKQTTDTIVRHQKVFVSIILVLALMCLLYYHARSTKTAGIILPVAQPSQKQQYHVDFPNSHIVSQTSDKMMRLPEPDVDQCRQQCEDTDWCHFWEHNPVEDSCVLYRAISKGSNYEAAIEPHTGSHVGVFERKLTDNLARDGF